MERSRSLESGDGGCRRWRLGRSSWRRGFEVGGGGERRAGRGWSWSSSEQRLAGGLEKEVEEVEGARVVLQGASERRTRCGAAADAVELGTGGGASGGAGRRRWARGCAGLSSGGGGHGGLELVVEEEMMVGDEVEELGLGYGERGAGAEVRGLVGFGRLCSGAVGGEVGGERESLGMASMLRLREMRYKEMKRVRERERERERESDRERKSEIE